MTIAPSVYAIVGLAGFVIAMVRMHGDPEMPPPHRFAFAVGIGVCWPVVLIGALYLNWRKLRGWNPRGDE